MHIVNPVSVADLHAGKATRGCRSSIQRESSRQRLDGSDDVFLVFFE